MNHPSFVRAGCGIVENIENTNIDFLKIVFNVFILDTNLKKIYVKPYVDYFLIPKKSGQVVVQNNQSTCMPAGGHFIPVTWFPSAI